MAYPSARRLVEAAITHLRPLSITLMKAPSARSALALSARASSSLGFDDAAFQASSAASGVGGSSPTPSAVCVFASAAPATTSTTFPADAILAFEDAFTSSAASAAASRAGSFSVIAFHDAFASPAASAASTSSPTLAYLVVTSSDADDDSDCTVPAASSARGSSPTPSAVYCFTSAAPLTIFPEGTFPAASGAGSSRTPTPMAFSSVASLATSAASVVLDPEVIGSGAEDNREAGSVASRIRNYGYTNAKIPSPIYTNTCLSSPIYNTTRLTSPVRIHKRCYSGCWTPWERTRPKEMPSTPLGVDEMVSFLRDLEPSDEDEKKLKKVFFDKFYAGKIVDPSTFDLKLDVLLHRVDENTQLAKDIKGTKKWGTFVFRGKKLDLSTVVAAIIGMF